MYGPYGPQWPPPSYGGYPPSSPISFVPVPQNKEKDVFKILNWMEKKERKKEKAEEEKKKKEKEKASLPKSTVPMVHPIVVFLLMSTFGLPVGAMWWFMIIKPCLAAFGVKL